MTKCGGCGAVLQSTDPKIDGFVEDINQDKVCKRCFKIKNYNDYSISSTNFLEYEKMLKTIKKGSIVFHVVDIFDISNINKISECLSSFKKIMLITKKDILPKSVKEYKLIDRIKSEYPFYDDYVVVSSNKNYNLDFLYNKIKSYKTSEVYFVGNTNSGKSTLINKLMKNYSNYSSDITTSHFSSTTLSMINVRLNDKITLIDTPGIVNEKSFINNVSLEDIKKIIVKDEVKPRVYQMIKNSSFFIEDFCQINYESDINDLIFYLSNKLKIKKTNINNENVLDLKEHKIEVDNDCDLVIEGLCFVKCVKSCKFTIYTNENVSVYKRDKLI